MNNIPTPPPDEHEELVHPDDSIIGKAARWSLVVAVAMAVVVFGVILLFKRKTGPLPQQVTQISAPKIPDKPKAEIPVAGFTDITKEAGITFVHHNGAYGDKLLPETMGGGVAFFDFDNDGAPDLLFINSTDWPGHLPAAGKSATRVEGQRRSERVLRAPEKRRRRAPQLAHVLGRLPRDALQPPRLDQLVERQTAGATVVVPIRNGSGGIVPPGR